ncbi:MAG: PAS domain S-box protein [Ignavibacteriae bacterium]|nr:MAG: PAS domain S-box protein [Ignavibacteriota bacterium]
MKKFIQIIIVVFILPAGLFSRKNDVKFEHLYESLSQKSVICISQDRKGFMWFGTYDGLHRYDGYKMKIYKSEIGNPYSLSNNAVRFIYEDRSGTLWIGTDGGLNQFDREKERFIRYSSHADDPNSLSGEMIQWICEDTSGLLWIGTFTEGLIQFDPRKKQFTRYLHDPKDSRSISNNMVFCAYVDRSGSLWIATNGGLDKYEREKNQFIHYTHDPENPRSLAGNGVYRIYEDRFGVLWIGTLGGGLDRFDREKKEFIHYRNRLADPFSLSSDVVRSIHEDRSGSLWIGTDGGLNRFDREKTRFLHYQYNSDDPFSLSNNIVLFIYEDRSGILWIGNDYGGINKFDRGKTNFVHYRKEPENANSLSSDVIYSMAETNDGGEQTLWIGTQGGGLNKYDKGKNLFTHYRVDPKNPNSLSDNDIRAILEDRYGALWIGTSSSGLCQLDRTRKKFIRYFLDSNNPYSLNSNSVFSIYEDRSGALWIGTYGGGLNLYDRKNNRFTQYVTDPRNPNSLSDNFIWSICEDRNGMLWIGTSTGGLDQFDREKNQFIHHRSDPNDPNSLSSNKVLCLHEDRSGVLWVGTTDGLNKFDREKNRFTRYRQAEGLPSNTIQSILEDDHGNLWIGTQEGLSKFSPGTKRMRNFKVSHGLQSNEFGVNACCKSQNGELYFGGIKGFNVFFPDSIKDHPYIPPIVVTDFQIFNKSVSAGKEINGHVILDKSISETKEINLSYKENVFLFEFASLHFASPDDNQYAYMMEGFDQGWNYTDAGRRVATYTNLGSGEYIFRVKGSNSDGVWNEEGASIRVIITPPYWETFWFKMILLGFVAGGVFWVYQWRNMIAKQRELVELAKRERKYRNLFENSPAGMVRFVSNSWDVLEANHALLDMFGVKTSEEIKQIFQTVPQSDREQIISTLKSEGTIKNYEVSLHRLDKTERCISVSGMLFSEEGYIEGVIIDVTERKRLEAKQLRAHRIESIGVLASGMAHDLKNLLVPVKMAAELMKRRHEDPKDEAMLTSIGQSAEQSINLVQQVLSFVRGVEGLHIPLQAAGMLSRVLSVIQENMPQNIEFISKMPSDPVTVLGDETQLRQVLVNLIANAKDAMPEGGRLTVTLSTETVNKTMAETIPSALEGTFAVWSIADTGTGIPSEQLEKIFEPFFTTKEITKGTGLGLSIVAGIVKGHKGFMSVQSTVGKGTTFYVYLPIIRAS